VRELWRWRPVVPPATMSKLLACTSLPLLLLLLFFSGLPLAVQLYPQAVFTSHLEQVRYGPQVVLLTMLSRAVVRNKREQSCFPRPRNRRSLSFGHRGYFCDNLLPCKVVAHNSHVGPPSRLFLGFERRLRIAGLANSVREAKTIKPALNYVVSTFGATVVWLKCTIDFEVSFDCLNNVHYLLNY